MQLDHEFLVPVPVDQAWEVLLDIERIAPCMPGATLESVDDEGFRGKVKVKVGPIQVTYGGRAVFVERDREARRVVIDARGKEARGSGTANATITARLVEAGDSTTVLVGTDLAITGKPAQFGRGVMAEVGTKLIGRFATCLADELAADRAAAAPSPAGADTPSPAGDDPTTPLADPAAPSPAPDAASSPEPVAASGAGPDDAPAAGPGAGDAGPVGQPGPGPAGDVLGSAVPDTVPEAWTTARAPAPAAVLPPRRPSAPRRNDEEAIDLLDAAGAPVLRRALPVAAVLVLLLLLRRLVARRRR